MEKRKKIDLPIGSDAELFALVDAFEACTWPYERWTHRAHLAVAAVYVSRYAPDEALDRARRRIDAYNRTCGDPAGYHETITRVFLALVRAELTEPSPLALAERVDAMADRLTMDTLQDFYSPERLWSPEARAGWIAPDRRELP